MPKLLRCFAAAACVRTRYLLNAITRMENRRLPRLARSAPLPVRLGEFQSSLTHAKMTNPFTIRYYSGPQSADEAINYALNEYSWYAKTTFEIFNVKTRERIGSFSVPLCYYFCCGMREIGNFGGGYHTLTKEEIPQLIQLFHTWADETWGGIGALTLTEHIRRSTNGGKHRYVFGWVQQLVDNWPDASHAEPFFNPNSGNFVTQWVLPFKREA